MLSKHARLILLSILAINTGCATDVEEERRDPTSVVGGWTTFINRIHVPDANGSCGFTLYLAADNRYAVSYYCSPSSTDVANNMQAEAGTYTKQGGRLALSSQRSSCYAKGPTLETFGYELDGIGWQMSLQVRDAGDGGFPTVVVDNKGNMQLASDRGSFDLTPTGGTFSPKARNTFGCFSPSGSFKKEGGTLITADIDLLYQAVDGTW